MNSIEIFVKITSEDKIDDLKQVLEKMNWKITWSNHPNVFHVLVPQENNTLCCEQSEVVESLSKYDWVSNVEISYLY